MSAVFFDTNVLLYTLAEGDRRQSIATQAMAQGGTTSMQVLNEFASVAYRKLKMPWPEVAETLLDVRAWCGPPLPLTLATHEAALRLAPPATASRSTTP